MLASFFSYLLWNKKWYTCLTRDSTQSCQLERDYRDSTCYGQNNRPSSAQNGGTAVRSHHRRFCASLPLCTSTIMLCRTWYIYVLVPRAIWSVSARFLPTVSCTPKQLEISSACLCNAIIARKSVPYLYVRITIDKINSVKLHNEVSSYAV